MSYDEIPYDSFPVPYASPAAIALASHWHGGPRPRIEGARVLELGCGDGAHLLPLAFHDPSASFLGVDASARAIAAARKGAEELGLGNARFEHGDLATLALPEASIDYVIAHGVYSWIDAARRAALRQLARRVLAPAGLAYLCFNALPGWGVRGSVRDALRGQTIAGARRLASALRDRLAEPQEPWGALLAHELARVEAASDGYLAHEYLAPNNRAFWLSDVVADCAQDGLRYAGDALALQAEGWVSPELAGSVEAEEADPLRRAELIDLLCYRQLRGVLFARDDSAPGPALDPSLLDTAYVCGVVRALHEPFDLRPGVEERFVSSEGLEVGVDSALGKMALLVLAARFPDAFTMPALAAEATDALAMHGITAESDALPDVREGLMQLVAHRALLLRLDRPALGTKPGTRPCASVLTRWEAQRRAQVTTPIHLAVPLEPVDRAIVAELDGRKESSAVAGTLTARVVDGSLALEGAPSSALRVRPLLEERIAQLVATLGRWGLVR